MPQTPSASGRSHTVPAADGRLVTGPSPDLRRSAMHVVNSEERALDVADGNEACGWKRAS